MADQTNAQLTEEEQIAKKVRQRKILSAIFGGVALISIVAFIILMSLSGQNKDTQTALDTQELRSKLKQMVALERNYYNEHQELVDIRFLALSKEIDRFNPNIDGSFRYRFDSKTGIATGLEKDASNDINGDEDGKDGLTLSINWEPGVSDGSDLFWTEEDIAGFAERKAAEPTIPVNQQ